MILVRSPLRLTFGGGGTDLPSYYERFGGFCVSAAIAKYVYVACVNPFTPGIYAKHRVLEEAVSSEDIAEPHIRGALLETGVSRVALTTFADIPAGTGLGSSGAFSCALLKALHLYRNEATPQDALAEEAYTLEVEAGIVTGKQDHYASVFGGISGLGFTGDASMVAPINLSPGTLATLGERLSLWYLGSRDSTPLQQAQVTATQADDEAMLRGLHKAKDLGLAARQALESGDTLTFSRLLHEQYIAKRDRSPETTPPWVDEVYRQSCKYGSRSGKIIGAGGGGFLMLYADDPPKVRAFMRGQGLEETPFGFDFEGTKVIAS